MQKTQRHLTSKTKTQSLEIKSHHKNKILKLARSLAGKVSINLSFQELKNLRKK